MSKARIIIDDKKLKQLLDNTVKKTVRRYRIQDGVEYGVMVELGTSKMGARPALVPAFENVISRSFVSYIKEALARRDDLDPALSKAAFDIQRGYAENVPVNTGALKNSIVVFISSSKVGTTEHVETG